MTAFSALLFIGGGLAAMTWLMVRRMTPPTDQAEVQSWLIGWTLKGIAVPFLIWGLMNFGLSWSIQPFMPEVQAALNTPGTFAPAFVVALGSGVFVICSYWAAVTLGWVAFKTARGLSAEAKPHFRAALGSRPSFKYQSANRCNAREY